MEPFYIIAVDIGTSSVRSVVLDSYGKSSAESRIPYRVLHPAPGFEEQDPDDIREKVLECIRECCRRSGAAKARIKGLCFSSQMYGIFALDGEGNPLCSSILWSDSRAEQDAQDLKAASGDALYSLTGCPASSLYPISKIAWLKRVRPEVFGAASLFVSIKEYVMKSLINQWVVDYSMASATGLFDIRRHRWSPEALEAVGIRADQLARPVSGGEGFEVANRSLLEEWGLPAGVLLFPGGGDGPLANLGAGAGGTGAMNIDLGTSGAARIVTDQPLLSPAGELWCFCLTKTVWTCGGILSNGGNTMVWLWENLLTDQPGRAGKGRQHNGCASLEDLAAGIRPGAEGVFFLPYLRQARSPSWEPGLAGTLFGLKAHHDSRHVVRAAIEAIGYDLKSILDILEERGGPVRSIVVSGGLCRGTHIPRIIADILGREIRVAESTEASLRGAAIFGLHAMGVLKALSFEQDGASEVPGSLLIPDKKHAEQYRTLHQTYQSLVDLVVRQAGPLLEGLV